MAKKSKAEASTKTEVSNVNIGISDKNRQAVANELQIILADEHILYAKTRNFHWNVEGVHFGQLHKLFEAQYTELAEMIDEVAERIRKVGHYTVGTLSGFLKIARLLEHTDVAGPDREMIASLLDDHETIIREVRNAIDKIDNNYKDAGTADFLTGLMEQHETMAWMLRAHLA
ncbi:Dps family protein [Chitinophagaceae bacterium MMS25-I14]